MTGGPMEPCAECGRPVDIDAALLCTACVPGPPAPRPYGQKPMWYFWPDADHIVQMIEAGIRHQVSLVVDRAVRYAVTAGFDETQLAAWKFAAHARCVAYWEPQRDAPELPKPADRRAELRIVAAERATAGAYRSPDGSTFEGLA